MQDSGGYTIQDLNRDWATLAESTQYESRNLDAQFDFVAPNKEILEDAVLALAMSKNLLLRGPTGSGKTRFSAGLAKAFDLSMESINCSVDLDVESLLGFKTLSSDGENSEISFVEGPVVRAMRHGRLLYIDEINMARPETLPILNGILDYRRQLTNPFTSEVVSAHDDFRVIAAINEGYVGTTPMNEALKNRFVVIDIPYLSGRPLTKLLRQQSRLSDGSTLNHFSSLSTDLVSAIRVGELSDEAGSVRALIDACDFAAFIPPLRAVERAIAAKLDDEREREVVLNLARTYFAR